MPGLACVPATIDLAGAEIELVSLVARESRLQRALDTVLLARRASRSRGFDYVFIDCPPSLGLLTINAFVAAPEVFIPIQCEYYALEGLGQLIRNVELIQAHLNPAPRGVDDPAHHVRRSHAVGGPGGRRGAAALR